MTGVRRSGKTVSIVSGKGGVGKTAIALSLASELAVAGNEVVLIDFDLSNRGLSEHVSGRGGSMAREITPSEWSSPRSAPLSTHGWCLLKVEERISFCQFRRWT